MFHAIWWYKVEKVLHMQSIELRLFRSFATNAVTICAKLFIPTQRVAVGI